MLTEFSIGNYQAFSTPQRVPIKPITLVFGPNSAGKSSLLRSLLVARHAILNGKLSKSEGAGERHPGTYMDMVRNGSSNPITFEFTVQSAGDSVELALSWREKEAVGLETVALSLRRNKTEVVSYSHNSKSRHLQISSMGDAISQLMLEARPESDADGRSDVIIHPTIKKRLALQSNVAVPSSDTDHYRVEDSGADEFDFLSVIEEKDSKGESTEISSALMKKLKTAIDSIKLEISEPIKVAADLSRDTLKKLIYHGPIRPICDEITKDRQTEPGMTEWWNLAAEPKLLAKVNHWLAGDAFKIKYRLEFDRLFPDSSLRQLLQSLSGERSIGQIIEAAFESKLDSDEAFLDHQIDSVVSDFEEAEYEDANERAAQARQQARDFIYNESWDLGMDYYNDLLANADQDEIESFLLGGFNRTLADLRDMLESVRQGRRAKTPGGFDSAKVLFFTPNSAKAVSPSNMGIGFSQMMPLVASAFGSENRLIAIEQPELHVHPALQTELADLFIQSTKERRNRFLIETHSEHLILRLLRRVRETTDGDLENPSHALRPEDLCVLYVEPTDEGSRVIELPVTPDGDFSRPWPKGFFEERSAELF